MEDDERIDIEATLQPLADDRLVGDDLRLDISPSSIYFRLRDARAEARAEERQADNDPSLGGAVPAQWTLIRKLTDEALRTHSKDIEVACWLTEALTRQDGLAGLADGADVLVGLISRFWENGLYPSPEDDAPEDRLIAITGMSGQDRDGSLLQPLRKIVLFNRRDGTPITIWEMERARELGGLAASRPDQGESGDEPSFTELEADARGAGQSDLRGVRSDVLRADASWRSLEEIVAQVAEGDAIPSTGRVRTMIETVRKLVDRYLPDEPESEAAMQTDAVATPASAQPAPAGAGAATTPAARLETRDALLDELLRIAFLFRQSEPNSPLSFTVEEAVRRARMLWPDLLRELILDDMARSNVIAVSGMRPNSTLPPEQSVDEDQT